MKPLRVRGYTLVEILIVLAIIVVLAAILLPVFASARSGAYRVTCSSNLKQIGMAMQMYVNDWRFYPTRDIVPSNPHFSGWVLRVLPYIKSPEVFECPANENGLCRPDLPNPSTPPTFYNNPNDGSYDLNYPYVIYEIDENGNVEIQGIEKSVHFNFYRRPSSTILALDGDGTFVNPGYQPPPFQGVAGLKKYGVDAPHDEGANCLFVDGHVKYHSLQALTKRSLWTASGPE